MKNIFSLILMLCMILLASCGGKTKGGSDKDSIQTDSTDVFADDPWCTNFEMDGMKYRTCESRAYLSLNKESANYYFGELRLCCGTEDIDNPQNFELMGETTFKVKGKLDGNDMTLVIDSYSIGVDHEYLTDFHDFRPSQQVFKITNKDNAFSATALGNMKNFFDGGDIVVKVQGQEIAKSENTSADDEAIVEDFVGTMFDKVQSGEEKFFKKHCSSSLWKKLVKDYKDEFDGNGFASWEFRTSAQEMKEGSKAEYKIISVKSSNNGWYTYEFYDMGWRGKNRIKCSVKDGEVIMDAVERLYDEHEEFYMNAN